MRFSRFGDEADGQTYPPSIEAALQVGWVEIEGVNPAHPGSVLLQSTDGTQHLFPIGGGAPEPAGGVGAGPRYAGYAFIAWLLWNTLNGNMAKWLR